MEWEEYKCNLIKDPKNILNCPSVEIFFHFDVLPPSRLEFCQHQECTPIYLYFYLLLSLSWLFLHFLNIFTPRNRKYNHLFPRISIQSLISASIVAHGQNPREDTGGQAGLACGVPFIIYWLLDPKDIFKIWEHRRYSKNTGTRIQGRDKERDPYNYICLVNYLHNYYINLIILYSMG